MTISSALLQHTYDVVPHGNEAHLHLINSLACPIEAKLSSADGLFNEHADLDFEANTVFYGLEAGKSYTVDVRTGDDCKEIGTYTGRFAFEAAEASVTGALVRAGANKEMEVRALAGKEEPKKESGGDSKIRLVCRIVEREIEVV